MIVKCPYCGATPVMWEKNYEHHMTAESIDPVYYATDDKWVCLKCLKSFRLWLRFDLTQIKQEGSDGIFRDISQ